MDTDIFRNVKELGDYETMHPADEHAALSPEGERDDLEDVFDLHWYGYRD